jgi:hypothetical protein
MLGTAWEITQFYRGEVFTMVDCLLTFKKPNKAGLALIASFCDVVLMLIAAWLKKFRELIRVYDQAVADPELYYTNPEAALVLCWPEMMLTLKRIMNKDVRCFQFFTFKDDLRQQWDMKTAQFANGKSHCKKILAWFVEKFYEADGW